MASFTTYAYTPDAIGQHALALPDLYVQSQTFEHNKALQNIYHSYAKLVIYAPRPERAENLYHCLHSTSMPCQLTIASTQAQTEAKILIRTGSLRSGFICLNTQTVYISENDLLGRLLDDKPTEKPRNAQVEQVENWQVGSLIVHRDFGIGRFDAFTTINRDGKDSDFLVLAYADEDKLYVGTNQFHLLSRYIGPQQKSIALTSLTGKKWQAKKQKALENADLFAEKLLSQHALRQHALAQSLTVAPHDLAQFCERFPYTETPDQKAAIDVILEDIQRTTPMNRLLCGDVGFGKTEVAMRAAFVCAFSGHQAAILAPTTLLTKQHFETFSQRFAPFPIRIAMLSRLTSKAEQDSLKQALSEGKIDIIIATHGLLQPDITFKNLGLFVIDEEHKFGVKQKELIQSISSHAHTLAMSATPIPRTMHMTLAKLRDISIIATPPKNRQAVQTFIHVYTDDLVKDAILREFQRGGQCYVIHNDIQALALIQDNILGMLPHIRCRIMHAKQSKAILQETMRHFQQGHFDVLLATTIVESGIDIPNANTIIIQRADLLGLSQIHQLRGRVGRSHHQAYAYLLTPPQAYMTEEGRARMHTLSKQKSLGSGLNIALEDLEIRGAGDLLGKKQSGNAEAVGLSLYNTMLARAARKRMGLPDTESSSHIEVDLGLNAHIPERYIRDFASRLHYYRLISCAETADCLQRIRSELEDRYGMMPESTVHLFNTRAIQQLALGLHIVKIMVRPTAHDLWLTEPHHCKHVLQHTAIAQEPLRIIGKKIRITPRDPSLSPLQYLAITPPTQ